MDIATTELTRSVAAAMAMDVLGFLDPDGWVQLASHLIATHEDADLVALACLYQPISRWDIEPLVSSLTKRLGISFHNDDQLVDIVARLVADDLRREPAAVTYPMIRMLARLGADAELVWLSRGLEDYLDCDCYATFDPRIETELAAKPTLALPAEVTRLVAAQLRSTLPATQPSHAH